MRSTRWLLILLCAASLYVFAQDSNEGSASSAIRALEREWVAAQSRNDNRALDTIFDNELVYLEYGKLVTKGEYLSRIRGANPQLDEITMEPMKVLQFGDTAIVVGAFREKRMKGGTPSLTRWRFLDTWVYKKSKWVLVAAAATPVTD